MSAPPAVDGRTIGKLARTIYKLARTIYKSRHPEPGFWGEGPAFRFEIVGKGKCGQHAVLAADLLFVLGLRKKRKCRFFAQKPGLSE
jgi:hypothetical protein